MNPSQLHVVVDSMLGGLGRQLRCCGVDVRVLTSDEDHSQAAKAISLFLNESDGRVHLMQCRCLFQISRQENRIILTAGTPFHAVMCCLASDGFLLILSLVVSSDCRFLLVSVTVS